MKTLPNLSPRTMLPMLVLVCIMVLSLRLGDMWVSVTTGELFTAVQPVQAASDKEDESGEAAKKKKEKKKKKSKKKSKKDKKEDAEVPKKQTRKELSAESKLYQQLAGRRDQLEKRARELDEREALVGVAEVRIEQKIKEMQTLRKQLESLVGQASGAQQQQLTNLVKVYESMKPKDAAKIFEALQMRVLLNVVQRMKPKSTAAVLAKMNPEKAKDITVALTRRDQLPQIK